ncbi:unnamed protein product, partial [Didymodactylos carnosus]
HPATPKKSNYLSEKRTATSIVQININELLKPKYTASRQSIKAIENKLTNIDLTIGLYVDEILALYELLPSLFNNVDNLFDNIAEKMTQLMYKGYPFHILRGRPLRCQSKLLQRCLNYVLQSRTPPYVLTVIGEQSSAKSSLLNAIFGCNFRTSSGRCTIGIYLSVVQWKSHTIVILDTEGLLSLEESGSIFDNQMVSMAMITSHLVLINHKGEFSTNLEHLIGMSFYAKLQIRPPLKPKLLFVLRDQADCQATNIFYNQLAKLKENLYKDTKFLKATIDEELEIEENNVVLLPNAFSSDMDPVLNMKFSWRNQTFPTEIIGLRDVIFRGLHETSKKTEPAYSDMAQLYSKIYSNWNSIDKLGPRLLACKTLSELSIQNELRDIAHEIVQGKNDALLREGQQQINIVLTEITAGKQVVSNENLSRISEGFQVTLNGIYQRFFNDAIHEFKQKSERSCYLPEAKEKAIKLMGPPIKSTKYMVRADFDDRLHSVVQNIRFQDTHRKLMHDAQCNFEENKHMGIEEMQRRVEQDYETAVAHCKNSLESLRKSPEDITQNVLRIYRNLLDRKAANATKGSIYNRVEPLQYEKYLNECTKLGPIWNQMKNAPARPYSGTQIRVSSRRNSITTLSKKMISDEVLDIIKKKCRWFTNMRSDSKVKNILGMICQDVSPELNKQILKLVHDNKYSDPQTLIAVLANTENMINKEPIMNYDKYLDILAIANDFAVISLRIVIDEAIRIENENYRTELD